MEEGAVFGFSPRTSRRGPRPHFLELRHAAMCVGHASTPRIGIARPVPCYMARCERAAATGLTQMTPGRRTGDFTACIPLTTVPHICVWLHVFMAGVGRADGSCGAKNTMKIFSFDGHRGRLLRNASQMQASIAEVCSCPAASHTPLMGIASCPLPADRDILCHAPAGFDWWVQLGSEATI